jgi:phosphate transport system substrate-binding protein
MPTTPSSPLRRMLRAALRCSLPWLLLGATSILHAEELRIGGTGAGLGTMQLLADAYAKTHPDTRIAVLPSMGSSGGIKAVLSGALQIAVSSRPLNEAELAAGASGVEYGRTPFVFAMAAASKVAGLTTQELVDIYAGRTEQWPDGKRIRVVLRPIGDADSELIKGMSGAMREAATAAEQRKGMAFTVTDQDTAASIEKIAGALGPATIAQIVSENRPLKALPLNGVAPSAASIADGSYPLHKALLLVSSPKSPAAAQDFLAFVRSAPGREILRQTGHWVK